MFQKGDLVVYGPTGVCRVEEITRLRASGPDRDRRYYLLKPLLQDGVIYTPVEGGKIPMRPVLTAREAEALIDRIPTLQVRACQEPTLQALSRRYQEAVRTGRCQDLVELVMSVYDKRRQAQAQRRRLGAVDERYGRQTQRLLYGELSVALGIPYEEVEPYIARRVEGARRAGS